MPRLALLLLSPVALLGLNAVDAFAIPGHQSAEYANLQVRHKNADAPSSKTYEGSKYQWCSHEQIETIASTQRKIAPMLTVMANSFTVDNPWVKMFWPTAYLTQPYMDYGKDYLLSAARKLDVKDKDPKNVIVFQCIGSDLFDDKKGVSGIRMGHQDNSAYFRSDASNDTLTFNSKGLSTMKPLEDTPCKKQVPLSSQPDHLENVMIAAIVELELDLSIPGTKNDYSIPPPTEKPHYPGPARPLAYGAGKCAALAQGKVQEFARGNPIGPVPASYAIENSYTWAQMTLANWIEHSCGGDPNFKLPLGVADVALMKINSNGTGSTKIQEWSL